MVRGFQEWGRKVAEIAERPRTHSRMGAGQRFRNTKVRFNRIPDSGIACPEPCSELLSPVYCLQ